MKTLHISVPMDRPQVTVIDLMRGHVASVLRDKSEANSFHILSGAYSASTQSWQFKVTAPDALIDKYEEAVKQPNVA